MKKLFLSMLMLITSIAFGKQDFEFEEYYFVQKAKQCTTNLPVLSGEVRATFFDMLKLGIYVPTEDGSGSVLRTADLANLDVDRKPVIAYYQSVDDGTSEVIVKRETLHESSTVVFQKDMKTLISAKFYDAKNHISIQCDF